MEEYKSPLEPCFDDIKEEFISNQQIDASSNEKERLLSTINFSKINLPNEDIDVEIVKPMLINLLTLLNSGMFLTDFPNFLLSRVINLSFYFSFSEEFTSIASKFVFHLCDLSDEECFSYFDETVFEFLIKTITSLNNLKDVQICLYCLANFTSAKRPKTCEKINGVQLMNEILEFQSNFKNYKITEQIENCDIISISFELLSNCMTSYKNDKKVIESILDKLINFLKSGCLQFDDECSMKVSRIWQISINQTISRVIFVKKDEIDLTYFMNDSILDLFLSFIVTSYQYESEKLSSYVFITLENLSFQSKAFSLHLISYKEILCHFQPPDEWSVQAKYNYCRLILTVVRQISECRELNEGGQMLSDAMIILERSVCAFAPLMMKYIENDGFKMRKVAALVLCQFIDLNNSSILHMILQGYLNIVEDFVLLLDDNIQPMFAASLIKSLRILCIFGDSLVIFKKVKNPFLDILMNLNILSILDNYENENRTETKVCKLISMFREEINRFIEFQSIDDQQEDDDEHIELILPF